MENKIRVSISYDCQCERLRNNFRCASVVTTDVIHSEYLQRKPQIFYEIFMEQVK